jgi:type II secretory pathway component GspD/PulD (secretin)/outer membrane protein OmpA-like peptidoglycan-associated protein
MKNKRRKQRAIQYAVFALLLFLAAHAAGAGMEAKPNPFVILFPKGSANPDQMASEMITNFAGRLDGDTVQQVVVEGYSDSMFHNPTSPYNDNLGLSQARADNVAELLQKASGLPPQRFTSTGRGAANPVADNSMEAGRSANRRVEVRVIARSDAGVDPGPAAGEDLPVLQPQSKRAASLISMALDDVAIAEAFNMISRKDRTNIILAKDVTGSVSINLYNVTTDEAIRAIADSAGFAVRQKYGGYIILPPDIADGGAHDTTIRTFKVQYTEPEMVKEILSTHMSQNGKITVLQERNLIVIEDNPQALVRMERLLAEIDKQPRQILIEAKILEIKLDDNQSWGIDWSLFFSSDDTTGSIELSGTASPDFTGFIATLNSDDLTVLLYALSDKGSVRTLSTPKLLALENHEAEVIIGQRQGYRVTTTINQVTTESVEFLESGVILNVTPSVDGQGRIIMDIHPEVSTGTIQLGIPDKSTTEVTTVLLAEDGQPIFIGGLIKNTIDYQRIGIPVLGDIPVMGRLFSNIEEKVNMTETVVIITPYLIKDAGAGVLGNEINKMQDQVENINGRIGELPASIKDPNP